MFWHYCDKNDGSERGFEVVIPSEKDDTTADDNAPSVDDVCSLASSSVSSRITTKLTNDIFVNDGQVRAKNVVRVKGIPSDEVMAKQVHPLPRQVGGQLLTEPCSSSCSYPHLSRASVGHVIKVFMYREQESTSFLPLLLRGRRGYTIRMIGSDGKYYGGGVIIQEYKRLLVHQRASMVLEDRDGQPLAMCRLEYRLMGRRTYKIYGTRPLRVIDSQGMNKHASAITIASPRRVKECGVYFYPWFRYEERQQHRRYSTNEEERPYSSIQVWNGRDGYEPMWRAYPSRQPMRGTFAGDKEGTDKGYIDSDKVMQVTDKSGNQTYGTLVQYLDIGCQVTIAPGVDPALILCLAAIQADCSRDVE